MPDPSLSCSFKDVLNSYVIQTTATSDSLHALAMQEIDQTHVGLHRGSPALCFQPPHLQHLNKPFEWFLIGKFSNGYNKANPKLDRLSIELLRGYFTALDNKGDF